MDKIPEAIYVIRDLDVNLPDVEVDMTCRHDLDTLIEMLKNIPDSDGMLRTIDRKSKYKSTFENEYRFSSN